jgi:carbonic anhydrase/acetyltransferase-like protein (isoleucine patch superfamily)
MQLVDGYYIAPGVVITGNVRCAAGVNIWYGTVIRADLAPITLEPRVNIQDGCILHTDHDVPMKIEEGVVVGHRVVLHGSHIGRYSLIGMGAILLSECEIGEESLIAAGAVILERRRIPPRSVVMGMPGKVVRQVTDEELQDIRRNGADYLEMAQRYHRGEFGSRMT